MAPLTPPPQENQREEKKNPFLLPIDATCNFTLASALLLPPPFSSSPRKPASFFLDGAVAAVVRVRDAHAALVSSAERCLLALGATASGNPFLGPLLALPVNFHNSFQIHCRNIRGTKSLSAHNFAAILPGDSVAGLVVANGIANFLNIYNTLLVVRLVLTWFPSSPPAIVSPLSTLCDPYLNIFRGIIPPLGGTLDLSPILAFLVLNALTSTAAALPAELPVTGASEKEFSASSSSSLLNLTKMQKKWMQRRCHK